MTKLSGNKHTHTHTLAQSCDCGQVTFKQLNDSVTTCSTEEDLLDQITHPD